MKFINWIENGPYIQPPEGVDGLSPGTDDRGVRSNGARALSRRYL